MPDFYLPIFDIEKIKCDLVDKAIENPNSTLAWGYHRITSFLVKAEILDLSKVLPFLCSYSIHTKTFPELWKKAKVTPLFKSSEHDKPTNYTPIGILPTLCKILERLVHDHLYEYLTDNDLLAPRQSGFSKGYSTGT